MIRFCGGYLAEIQYYQMLSRVKPAQKVTCIKQSPVLKGHLFLVLS